MKTATGFKCVVNRNLSFGKMIKAGKYDWVHSGITAKHFITKGSGSTETNFELVHFDCNIESDEAVKELNKRGLRPADLAELLAFGAAFPEEQRKYDIAALAFMVNAYGDCHAACLCRYSSWRNLGLHQWSVCWSVDDRILAVRD